MAARRRRVSRPTSGTRASSSPSFCKAPGLRDHDGHPPADVDRHSRTRPSASRPSCSTTTTAVYELIARVFDGRPEGLTRDDVLDNITLYWLTNTGISAARLYWENKLAFFAPKGVTIPVAVSAFPDELYQAPRSWAERAYPKLVYYNKRDKGGHFAAWEQPKSLSEDIREGLRSLRTTAG